MNHINLLFKFVVVSVSNVTALVPTFSAVGFRLLLALPLLEFHVAKVHNGSNYFIAAIFFIRQEAKDVHGSL